jgi:hypothetical protein
VYKKDERHKRDQGHSVINVERVVVKALVVPVFKLDTSLVYQQAQRMYAYLHLFNSRLQLAGDLGCSLPVFSRLTRSGLLLVVFCEIGIRVPGG